MTLKRIAFIVLLCFVSEGFSQDKNIKVFELVWDDMGEVFVSNGLKLQTPIVKDNFVDIHGLPTYSLSWKVEEARVISYTVKNELYESMKTQNFKTFQLSKIPEKLSVQFAVSKERNTNIATLSMIPLIKEGNLVKRLISFDLEYQLGVLQNKSAATLAEDSVLANGTWYKFSVDKTGVFKIDADFLNELGINTSNLNPKNIKIYGNGGAMLPFPNSNFRYLNLQENSIYVRGENDNFFNSEDYVLFYAKGPDHWITENENTISHRNNIFSDESFYFISVDGGFGKRIANQIPVNDATTNRISTFKDYLFLEEDKVNLFGTGQQWFGDSFETTNTRTYNFNFSKLDTSKEITLVVRGVSGSSSASSMTIRANNEVAFEMIYPSVGSSSLNRTIDLKRSAKVFLTSESIDVEITYDNRGNPSAQAYLDYIEIIGDKLLEATGSQFSFRNFESKSSGKVLEYEISNSNNIDMVWDVTDFLNPKKIADQNPNDANYSFKAISGNLNEYVVLNDSDYYSPKIIENSRVENQNLHALRDIQYLIITRKEFLAQAQILADYYNNNSDIRTEVVDLEKIYNEFGSGSEDITAIRDFVKFLYDNSSNDNKKIKYLCLFGDSSYDYKDRIPDNNNIVPAFQSYRSFNLIDSYVTDDYYGMMDDNEGELGFSDKQDVATGRILISTVQEAENAVNKILNYYNEASLGKWRNQITLMADDMRNASEFDLQNHMEEIADLIKENKPQYNIEKIYADAFKQVTFPGGDRYPDVNLALSNAVERGSLLIDYFGHGGEAGLGDERFLEISDIRSWNNFNTLPLFITVTCEFSRFDNPALFTAGEEMILNKNGGSVNLISTTREVYVNYGKSFNNVLIRKLLDFNRDDYTIAEALMRSKNERPSPFLGQHYFIFSLGDPAMKLGIPKPNVSITKINDRDVTVYRDTLKALSKIKLEGVVTDVNSNSLTGFNGTLGVSVFDKEIDKMTLDNDRIGLKLTFDVRDNKVFNGKAKVENGIFNVEFVVPRDIKIAFGKAKISLYADNKVISKGGYDLETVIGGINENPPEDVQGPGIELYVDDESFVDGGKTSRFPILIAKLSDENGINTSLNSIGHAILAVLDGNEENPIQLNDFYESELGDHTKGTITYTLRNLSLGPHTLKIKAWDTYNNPNEKTLTFNVVGNLKFELKNVLNYPNPFINHTEFWFEHKRPNELLDVKIYIYTVSGKLVKSINQSIQTSEIFSRSITWNGKDDFGKKVGKGVYVYKIVVTSKESGESAEKYEKLVLLQ